MYMETVSLNDDAPAVSTTSYSSTVVDVESLESQFVQPAVLKTSKSATEVSVPVSDSDSDDDLQNVPTPASMNGKQANKNKKDVAKAQKDGNALSNGTQKHVLPPLRVMTQKLSVEERDYVDPTLFSPEVSRHAMEVAHRRAKAIATEVREMKELEKEVKSPMKTKMSPAEAVGIIGGAFVSSLQRATNLVKSETKEYDLLSGSSPIADMSNLDDLDTDGDGLQLSPDAIQNDRNNFRAPKLRPALKRISALSAAVALNSETSSLEHQKKKGIQWHEDVLDADEEFCDDVGDEQETLSLMVAEGDSSNSGSPRPQYLNFRSKSDGQLTPRSRKKRKKLVRSMMRRLTPHEKEELYRQRPDLMIVPNWAQKYREELAGENMIRWNAWLLAIMLILVVLLLVFILLIVRHRTAAAVQ